MRNDGRFLSVPVPADLDGLPAPVLERRAGPLKPVVPQIYVPLSSVPLEWLCEYVCDAPRYPLWLQIAAGVLLRRRFPTEDSLPADRDLRLKVAVALNRFDDMLSRYRAELKKRPPEDIALKEFESEQRRRRANRYELLPVF